MNFQEIKIVSKCLPVIDKPAILPTAPAKGEEWAVCPFDEQELSKYVRYYNELNFAWKSASLLAKHDCILPIFPHGTDKWFYRAWLLLKDTKGNEGNEAYDPIREAWVFEHRAEHRPTRELIRSLLITTGATVERVATVLGLPLEVIEAYECLFFNAISRKQDQLFLRNKVYPDTRMEEMVAGYFEKANLGRVLLRLGYNHTMDDVLHFAGMRLASYREGITQAQAMEDFQQKMMANGLLLAACGFLNYSTHVSGLVAAKSLATATRIGGGEVSGGDEGLGEFVGSARAILSKGKRTIEGSIEVLR